MFEYVSLFLDRISRSPEERYQELLDAHSDWIDKIPHHF
ncbi:hypothetical protein JOC28_001704 [Streptococcus loxodontisalivarius]|uniref:Uncharacterized protein n=1 Tax=Streptococcus loxodontisalivarius TaxID=1349415 RepID=A0ABS2PTM6_9STRE|nr:hypothetical protein [Streptococcus loxodontisalivarius]